MANEYLVLSRRKWIAIVLAACAVSAPASADDPVSSNVRYSREIVRILQRRCLTCHRSTGNAEPIETYRQVREWGRAIREEVVEQRMPPPTAAPGFGKFRNSFAMTQRETATLLSWLDGGMPRGNDRDLPAPEPSHDSTNANAVRIALPQQSLPPRQTADVRRVSVTLDGSAPLVIGRVDVRSRVPQLFKGAMVYAGSSGERWVGGGIAGQPGAEPPAPVAALKRGDTVTVMLFYLGSEQPAVDTPELVLTPATTAMPGIGFTLDARIGRHTVDRSMSLWAMQAVPGEHVRTLEVRARHADGSTQVLAWLPRVTPDWPIVLALDEPVSLSRGATIVVTTKDAAGAPAQARVSFSATSETTPRP